MPRFLWTGAVGAFAVVALGGPVLAGPADQVHARVTGLRALGNAFKAVNDQVRGSGAVQPQLMQQYAQQILKASHDQYGWFPAGSGPQPGVKTAVRPEVWTRAAQFRAAQDAFARQADVFARTAAGGDAAAIRTEARKLGAACKSCHDNFRTSEG